MNPQPGNRRRNDPKPFPRWLRWTLSLGVVAASAVFIITLLPSGALDQDLTRVGQGQPKGVITYETAHPTAIGVMELVNRLDTDATDVEFLVANLGTPEGDRFAQQHDLPAPGILALFDGDGELHATILAPDSEAEILDAVSSLPANERG